MSLESRRRFSPARHLPLAALLALVAACADDGPVDDIEVRRSALGSTRFIDLVASDSNAPRRQVADIVDVGPNGKFVVAWIKSWGDLMYARYTIDGVAEGEPLYGGFNGWWVRANTSRTFSKANHKCTITTTGTLYINYFAAQINLDGAGNGDIVLDAHSTCGSALGTPAWTTDFGRTPIDTGARKPSVASKTLSNGGAQMLVVYGKGSQLLGRWCTRSSLTFGTGCAPSSPFVIDGSLSGGGFLFSSDVIYNAHSNTFIVGYTSELTGEIKNIVLSANASVPATVVRGATLMGITQSGPEGHGHHTSVSYNPNGDGTYVWWRQNTSGDKGIFTHDQMGNATSFVHWPTAFPGENHAGVTSFTCPVDQTRDLETRYLAAIPFAHDVADDYGTIFFIGGHAQSTTNEQEGWQGVTVVDSFAPPIRQLAVRGLYFSRLNRVQSVALGASENIPANQSLYLFATDQPD